MKLDKSFFMNVIFYLFEDILKVKIASNSYVAYELICAQICQKELNLGQLDFSKSSLAKYSKWRNWILERIKKIESSKGFSNDETHDFFGQNMSYDEIKSYFMKIIKADSNNFIKILKDETVWNRVFQYHSLNFNDVWVYDFTTLTMLKNIPKTELLAIMDLSSRKIVGWKLFPSKENTTSKALIQVFENSIEKYGKPDTIHSDSDNKNHSTELNLWAQTKNMINVSITKDMFETKFFVHGNQVIEWFNRTLKGYFYKLDNSESFLNLEYNQLESFINNTIEFYNNKAHKTLSTNKKFISPNEAYFENAVFDALKESWNNFKTENNQLVQTINIDDHQQLADYITTSPKFIQTLEKAEPSEPSTIHNIFNQFLQLISPLVYDSSDPLVKQYFDDKLPKRVKGPGWENMPGPFYYDFKNIKTSFSLSVGNLLALFSYVMSKVVEVQTRVIMADANQNKEEIINNIKIEREAVIETLKNEIVKSREEVHLLVEKIEYLENIQWKSQERELQLAAMREKRKNWVRQIRRSAINLGEFNRALIILKERLHSKASQTSRFNAARDRIALFILYFSGLRISNLFLISINDVEKFFIYGNNKGISVNLIKKREKVEAQQLIFAQAVVNKYIYGEFNLIEDLNFVKNHIFEYNKNSKNPVGEGSLKFYTSFKNPLKPVVRQSLTTNINQILKEVSTVENSGAKLLSSHSFWINVITQMIKHYGYSQAQKFAHHADIRSTALYDWNIFDPKMTRTLTSILAETRTGKKYITEKEDGQYEEEAFGILKNSD